MEGEGQTVSRWKGEGQTVSRWKGEGQTVSRWKGEGQTVSRWKGRGKLSQGRRGRGKLSSRWKGEGQNIIKGKPPKSKMGLHNCVLAKRCGPLYTLCTNMDVISRLYIKPYLTYSSNLFAMDPALMNC